MNWLRHGGIAAFIVRRLLLGLLVLFLVSVLVFIATQALGDPARAILGRDATPDRLAALQKQLGLDNSVVAQYFSWLGGLLHGDLGNSLAAQEPVSTLLSPRIVNSAVLVFAAAVVSIPISIAIGAWAALRREKSFDNVTSNSMLVLAALPEFVVGRAADHLVRDHGVPLAAGDQPGSTWHASVGRPEGPHPADLDARARRRAVRRAHHARFDGRGAGERLRRDGTAQGTERSEPCSIRHALPNSIGPVFQVIAINLAYLAGGVVVVEYVFNYPGIGSQLVDSVNSHDIPVVQALAMLIAGGLRRAQPAGRHRHDPRDSETEDEPVSTSEDVKDLSAYETTITPGKGSSLIRRVAAAVAYADRAGLDSGRRRDRRHRAAHRPARAGRVPRSARV